MSAAMVTSTALCPTRVLGLGLRASASPADLLAGWAALRAELTVETAKAAALPEGCLSATTAQGKEVGRQDAVALLSAEWPTALPTDLPIALPEFRADLPLVRWLAGRGQPLILIPRARLRGMSTPSHSPRSLAVYGTGSVAEACALLALCGQPPPQPDTPASDPGTRPWAPPSWSAAPADRLHLRPAFKSACGRLTLALACLSPATSGPDPLAGPQAAPSSEGTLP